LLKNGRWFDKKIQPQERTFSTENQQRRFPGLDSSKLIAWMRGLNISTGKTMILRAFSCFFGDFRVFSSF